MPELPEVETVRRGLEPIMLNQRIDNVQLNRPNLRFPFPKDFTKIIAGQTVTNLKRRAKYLQASLSNEYVLIMHLGMSGRFIINDQEEKSKHDHVEFCLHSGDRIVYRDPRRFGLMDLCPKDQLQQHKLFVHLGWEPLAENFTAEHLQQQLKGRKSPIKIAIMDQKIVVGVGNIYACEALLQAKIDPRRPAEMVTLPELTKLVTAIKDTLQLAIKAGGSTLRDHAQVDGKSGYFQHSFKVYNREKQTCLTCHSPNFIARISQGGRSTFFCPNCQK